MAKAKQRVLSIEIGYSLTQVCEMDYQSKHPKVYGVFSMKTPEGVINDGFIKISEQFVQELKSYISANGMTANKVIFAVSSTKIANREATIPMVKENQVREMILSNITDFFPVDPTKYQFAHNIMDTVTDDAGSKQYRVMVMAAPSEILDGYYELAKALNLELSSIDYSGNSIFQALRNKLSSGVNLTVKIDERSSLLTVTNNGVITMQRAGIYGANQVVDIMMETDVYGEPLSYDAAIRTLRRNNLVMKADDESLLAQKEEEAKATAKTHADAIAQASATGDTSLLAAATVAAKQADANLKMLRLRRDVTYAYSQLISSIVRVIDYYNSKNRDASIDHIVITGIAADFWGFAGLLSNELGREVEVLKDLAGTNIDQGLHLQDISLGDYITVIGAGLNSIGFMPASVVNDAQLAKEKNAFVSKDKLPMVVIALALSVSVALVVFSVVPYLAVKSENASLKKQQASLETYRTAYNEFLVVEENHKSMLMMDARTKNSNENLTDTISQIEKLLPSDTWVISMEVTEESITLGLKFKTKKEAAKAVMDLRKIEAFSSVSTAGLIEELADDGTITVAISVECKYGTNKATVEQTQPAETETVAPDDGTTETEE